MLHNTVDFLMILKTVANKLFNNSFHSMLMLGAVTLNYELVEVPPTFPPKVPTSGGRF